MSALAGAALAALSPAPLGAAMIGVLALVYWLLARIDPIRANPHSVNVTLRRVPLRRFARCLLAFAVPCISLGILSAIV